MTPIAPHITAFLRDYLPMQRGSSPHTCASYAYTFQLLFTFASSKLHRRPSDIAVEQLSAPLVTSFLEYLETNRKNTATTRNVRLAAIKTFFRYLEYRMPAALEQTGRIGAIPFKRADSRLVCYLTREQMQALLDGPDPHTREGIRDRAMLHVAFAAGLRVSELVGLRVEDVALQPTATILIRGKGRRERALPLWKETAMALRAWLAVRGAVGVPEVFTNAHGEQMTRWGFAYVLKRAVQTASRHCPSLLRKQISPHVIRHTCALLALQTTHDIRKVSLWLGHSSIQSTEIYTRVDPAEKLQAISALAPPKLRPGRFQPTDELLAIIKSSSLCGAKIGEDKEITRPRPRRSP